MLSALIGDVGKTVDVHAFTHDFILNFANSNKELDTSNCYEQSIVVDDEITRQDGIADCLAPTEMLLIADELFNEDENDMDRTPSRIASGMWFLGASIPEITAAYKECTEMQEELDVLTQLYDNRFKDGLASLYTFAEILSIVEYHQDRIMPYTNDYGSGKNAAEIAKLISDFWPTLVEL